MPKRETGGVLAELRRAQARGRRLALASVGPKAAADGDVAELRIYDEIGWFALTADDFAKKLEGITADVIRLRLNSPGGEVFDGTAIHSLLRQHPARVEVHIDGLAASIASYIALAGDEIHMAEGAYLMIHNPWSFALGDADDLRKQAEVLDKVTSNLARAYAAKMGRPEAEVLALMADETWFTVDEALEAGLVDHKMGEDKEPAVKDALARFDLSIFANLPEPLRAGAEGSARADDINRRKMRAALALRI